MRRWLLPLLLLTVAACDDDDTDPAAPDAGSPTDASPADQDGDRAPADLGADARVADATPSPDAAAADLGPDAAPQQTLDELLADVLADIEPPLTPLEPPAAPDPALFELGQALFFDPVLSGNHDVACASCHHPDFGLGDGLPLAVGTGAAGLGPARADGAAVFVARNSPALFDRGDSRWRRLFLDGRVEQTDDGVLHAPAPLPDGVAGVLAAQALFPMLDRVEMRGQPGDRTVGGAANELAALPDDDPDAIWAAIVDRLLAIPEYAERFATAFPDLAGDPPTIAHVANAIAAFEATAFAFVETPWDAYLGGDADALTDAQKLGAVVFYAGARCAACHRGTLFTDQRFHNVGVPQLGPGRGADAPYDHGREAVSGDPADRFAFRTPPLRNLAQTAPYMHNGALADLGDVMNHYAMPALTASEYDASRLPAALRDTVQRDADHLQALVESLSRDLLDGADGRTAVGLSNIRQFLGALNDPAAADLSHLVPESVPSGLALP